MASNTPPKSTPRKANTVTDPKNADDKSTAPTPPVESTGTKPEATPPVPTREPADANTAKHEKADIEAALSRHTFDGKGENAVPPGNFRGFETEGVEKKPLKSVDDVVQDVLNGNFGTTAEVVTERLRAAGYTNLNEIEQVYNKRVAAGAPRAF